MFKLKSQFSCVTEIERKPSENQTLNEITLNLLQQKSSVLIGISNNY